MGQRVRELNGTTVSGRTGSRNTGPRIVLRRTNPGFHHPVAKREIIRLLDSIGPIAIYGLRVVEAARTPIMTGRASLVFGRYEAPGRILLYEQPNPPWRLPGILNQADTNRFKMFGATLTLQPGSQITTVEWPKDSLRRFMLEGVFLHELGHHVLQQYKGKRSVRIARTQDHEAAAERFASRMRSLLRAEGRLPK